MKKTLVFVILGLIFCFSAEASAQKTQVMAEAQKVVAALKSKDMRRLASFVHPLKGVRFSPYSYLSDEDLTFKKGEVPSLFLLRRSYLWGSFDGSGEPINMGFPAYYNRFVYDRDFVRAPSVSYNKIVGRGNTSVNIAEVFPKAKFVEYHFPGTRKNDGMDWRSLRLIFERAGNRWFLVGISHDQWTI